MAMQNVYDFFHDVNASLVERGLERLDDMLRPAIMSGLLSDMLTASLAKHSRTLTVNCYSTVILTLWCRELTLTTVLRQGRKGLR